MQIQLAAANSGIPARSPFVSIQRKGDVLTLRPAGPHLSEREASIVAAAAHDAVRQIPALRAAVLDLSDVKVMSSFGLGMCIDLRNLARERRARTIICGLSGEQRDLFRMMKVDRLFTIAITPQQLADALK